MTRHYTEAEMANLARLLRSGMLSVGPDWRTQPAWLGLAADGLVVETVLHGRFQAVELTPAGRAEARNLGDRR